MAGFSQDMRLIEFDSFEAAFPVRPDEESAVKRRFMTLFVEDDAAAKVGGTSYVCKAWSFTGEEFAVKRPLVNRNPAESLSSESEERIVQGRNDALYEEYCNQLLVSHLRGFPRLYGFGTIGNEPAIVMEWVQGVSVHDFARDYAERGEPVPVAVIAALGVSVLEVLDTASRLDNTLIHRDISPSNIMIRTGHASVSDQVTSLSFDVCLIDFGVASLDYPRGTSVTMDLGVWRNGTPEYAPPEMLTQDIPHIGELRKSQTIDVFALCSVLYELYAGSTPWRVYEQPGSSPYRVKMENEPYPITPRSAADADFIQVLLSGLSVEQGARPSVRELSTRLYAFAIPDGPLVPEDEGPVVRADSRLVLPVARTPESVRFRVAGAEEGGRKAGEEIEPFKRAEGPITRRGFMAGALALAVAVATGAFLARSCGREAARESSYDFSNYPTAESVYAGDALYPVMRMRDSSWILRDVKSGAEVALGSGSREPGKMIDGLIRIYDPASGNYGFMTPVENAQGSWSCAWRVLPIFSAAGDFSRATPNQVRLAAVQEAESGLWGYVGIDGRMVIGPEFGAAARFANGYAAVRFKQHEPWGLVDSAGNRVLPARFASLGACSAEGLMAATEQSGGRWGFVNLQGEWVLEAGFTQVRRFSEGLAACKRTAEAPWEYLDAQGNTVIEARFADALPFTDGLAPVQDKGTRLWGLIDTTGAWRVEPRYLRLGEKAGALLPAHGSPANVYDIEGADKAVWKAYTTRYSDWSFGYGLIDEQGTWVVKPTYGDALIRQPGSICTGGNWVQSTVAVPVRASVDDYSWSELSLLAGEIAASQGSEAMLSLAKKYHLSSEDGMLDGSQGKWVTLVDGTVSRAVIVGFGHDERASGGKAGITFAFADAVAVHGMNNNAGFNDASESDDFDAVGGWNASELRGWLNGEFVYELPPDLQAVLVDVVKSSVVVPELELPLDDAGALPASVDTLVGQGVDKLWIPAVVELSGVKDSSVTAKSYPEWTAPLKAEGSQYRLFADAGVSERHENDVLVRVLAGGDGSALPWWLRSVEEWTFAEVLPDGSIDRRDQTPAAPTPQGVVPFFAL